MPQTFQALIGEYGSLAWELGSRLEAAVFLERFGNTPELIAAEYGPYTKGSLFITLMDGIEPAAASRIITERCPAGLKTLHDAAEAPWQLHYQRTGRIWDCATIAVAPSHRGTGVSMLLMAHILRYSVEQQVVALVALLDRVVFDLLASTRGPIHAIGPDAPYLGSPATLPVEVVLAEVFDPACWHDAAAYTAIVGLAQCKNPMGT